MGLLAKSTSGFGTLRVKGLKRVPNPPTRMRAFILLSSQPRSSSPGFSK